MMTPQIEEFVFPDADFPREFDIQLWAFIRLVWGEGLRGEFDSAHAVGTSQPRYTLFARLATC